ncbi:hypothetical protein T4D_10486 [Trichinella pseudospiralis]|uniref:Uncharacterized protein n=1 Tax=Trichinella pseudospiralis TaxID=6337 RepID=A0A0V1FJ28_TRIPS|nr:hypothetical protein T4D_10486 [Trichinella pseudospiralis]
MVFRELSLLHLQFSNLFPPREPTASGEHVTPPRSMSFYREQPMPLSEARYNVKAFSSVYFIQLYVFEKNFCYSDALLLNN